MQGLLLLLRDLVFGAWSGTIFIVEGSERLVTLPLSSSLAVREVVDVVRSEGAIPGVFFFGGGGCGRCMLPLSPLLALPLRKLSCDGSLREVGAER